MILRFYNKINQKPENQNQTKISKKKNKTKNFEVVIIETKFLLDLIKNNLI